MHRLCYLITFALVAIVGCNTNVTPPPIVIGHVSDKSRLDKAGDQAELGIRLALHELSGEALTEALNGRSIQVRHTDTRGDIDAYESQAVRLETINRCIALLGGYSGKEVAALDHVKAPILTFHGQPVSGASNFVFYLGMSVTRQGDVLARTVADDAKVKKIVLLVDERRPESATLADAFQKSFADARKVEAGAIQTLRYGKDADWSELMGRTRMHEPQAVVFAGAVQDFNGYHKAFRREYFLDEPTLVFAGNDGEQRLFEVAPGTKATVVLATAFYADPAVPKIADFMTKYRDAYHVEADVNSALAYDGLRILVESLKNSATQLSPDEVRKELLKTKDFAGVTGPLTITPERQVRRPLHVVQWQNGATTLIKTYAP